MDKIRNILLITTSIFLSSHALSYQLPEIQAVDVKDNKLYFSVNQAGYFTKAPKVAYITNFQLKKSVTLLNLGDKSTSTLKITPVHFENKELAPTARIDFDHVKTKGKYAFVSDGIRSPIFTVGDDIYREGITKLLRSYYLQRCGQYVVDSDYGIEHKACHVNDGVLARPLQNLSLDKSSAISATGGWHDAGDFGKYVSTTTVSVGRILSSYQHYPFYLNDINLKLPANPNPKKLPDTLLEMKVGLAWLLTMQNDNGLLFRKLSGNKWPSLMSPYDDRQTRYVYGVSTDDTAKFVATMALAARIFKDIDKKLAEQYLAAAEKSWHYLEQKKGFQIDWIKSDDRGSGPYIANSTDIEFSLTHDKDDRFWAAAELYITSKKNKYLVYINQNIELPLNVFEWKDPALLGKWHLVTQLCRTKKLAFCRVLTQQILAKAEQSLARYQASDYQLANQKFIWGSNKLVAEEGMLMLMAYQLNKDERYVEAAIAQADYLLGANPFSLSFITDVGESSVQNVSHIFARAEKLQIPGLLVGGPNNLAQAKIAPKNKGILSYVDHAKSYAVNEYAIDYNASAIALLIQLSTLHGQE